MVAFIHAGLDRLLIASSALIKHNPLQWVDPPPVDANIPLGDPLAEPDRLAVVWGPQASTLDVIAPTTFLGAPNDRLVLRHWPTQKARRGTVVFVPPWKLRNLNIIAPMVRAFNRHGFDVVGYPTPYHFERAPQGSFSGEFFATWDMPRTGWAIRAGVLELCALTESLRPRGPVVLLGTSLGGYLSAMMSVVAARYPHRAFTPDRLVLIVPPDSILDTFVKSPVGERYRTMLLANGGRIPPMELLEQLALPFSPSRFQSVVPGDNIMVAAAQHDAMVPLESSQRLANGFGARFKAYDAGHASALVATPSLWRDVGHFLDTLPKVDAQETQDGQEPPQAPPKAQSR